MAERDAPRFKIRDVGVDLSDAVEGELRREPLPDADAPCPHCGRRGWLLIETRAEPEYPFTRWRALACASCGMARGWSSAGRARPGRRTEIHGTDGEPVELNLPESPTVSDVVARANFAVMASAGTAELRSVSHLEGTVKGVTVRSAGVEVTTAIRSELAHGLPFEPTSPEDEARMRLAHHATDELEYDRGLSDAANSVRSSSSFVLARRQADAAESTSLQVDVAGQSVMFVAVASNDRWAMSANVDDLRITLMGDGAIPPSVRLQPL